MPWSALVQNKSQDQIRSAQKHGNEGVSNTEINLIVMLAWGQWLTWEEGGSWYYGWVHLYEKKKKVELKKGKKSTICSESADCLEAVTHQQHLSSYTNIQVVKSQLPT